MAASTRGCCKAFRTVRFTRSYRSRRRAHVLCTDTCALLRDRIYQECCETFLCNLECLHENIYLLPPDQRRVETTSRLSLSSQPLVLITFQPCIAIPGAQKFDFRQMLLDFSRYSLIERYQPRCTEASPTMFLSFPSPTETPSRLWHTRPGPLRSRLERCCREPAKHVRRCVTR